MAETIEDILPNKNQLKKEKISTPPLKSSTEILSELFRQFNAAPPEISLRLDSDKPEKKSKKKRKHKWKKKRKTEKRGRSSSDDSDQKVSRKKSKKSKHKKHKKRSKSSDSDNGYVGKKTKRSYSPDSPLPSLILQSLCKSDANERRVTSLDMGNFTIQVDNERSVQKPMLPEDLPELKPDITALPNIIDHIPIPKTPDISKIKLPDEFSTKSTDANNKTSDNTDKNKAGINKIQIKNLKFSSVFEANVKQAEEEARKKAEKYEDGELSSDSSSDSMKVPTDVESEDDVPALDLREKLNTLARHNSESDTGTKVTKR